MFDYVSGSPASNRTAPASPETVLSEWSATRTVDAAEMAVSASSILEHFELVEDIGTRQLARRVNTFLDPLFL